MSITQTTHQDASAKQAVMAERSAADSRSDASNHIIHADQRLERALSRKRARAIRYLELARRFGGSAYDRNEPRVFTMQFVSELEQENALRRASRNPWLESMLLPLASDGADHVAANRGNVLPFGPQIAPVETAAPSI